MNWKGQELETLVELDSSEKNQGEITDSLISLSIFKLELILEYIDIRIYDFEKGIHSIILFRHKFKCFLQ